MTKNQKNEKEMKIDFMLANCRSIVQKTDSVNSYFENTDLVFGIFIETWLNEKNIKNVKDELENCFGLGILSKNRTTRGGGVAVIYKKKDITFAYHVFFTGSFEILAAKAKLPAANKLLYVFALYYPPNMLADQVEKMNDLIVDEVLRIQIEGKNAIFVIAGDMNGKNCDCFLEIPSIKLIDTDPTRKDKKLDLCYTNAYIAQTSVRCPLWSYEGVDSDHRTVHYSAVFHTKKHTYSKIKRRIMSKAGSEKFVELAKNVDWLEINGKQGVNGKVDWFHEKIENIKNECFPLKTSRIRSDEDPWINDKIRSMIRFRDQTFREKGRGAEWKVEMWKVREKMRDAKKAFYDREVEKIYGARDKRSLAYTALKNISCPYRQKPWSITDIDPGKEEVDIVEDLAEYFNNVAAGHGDFDPTDWKRTYDRPIYKITAEMIEKRIKETKKPNSMVPGDIPPKLLTELAPYIAPAVANIFNEVPVDYVWPEMWKKEYQTVIPKKTNPADFSELRNLSCTNFLSKILESFILDSIRSEIDLSELQYGGIKGCGTDHFLIETWNNILESLDENGKAASLMSVDFSKAFNRLEHGACLRKLAEKSASNQTIGLVAAFLHGRTMCVRSGSTMSKTRQVMGGSPQGTKLGNLLFCISIDDITDPPRQTRETSPNQSAIPDHYLPENTSTPIRDNWHLDDSFDPNPYGMHIKKRVINDTIPFSPARIDRTSDVGTWEIGYVDDLNVGETLDIRNAIVHITTQKEQKMIRATGGERMYEIIKNNGKEVGMLINHKKTQLICIYTSPNANIKSYASIEQCKIESSETIKILGFLFGTAPSTRTHVDHLVQKFNKAIWSMIHLTRAGLEEGVLVRVYCSMLRPIIEYSGNVIHSMMTETETEMLEKCQRKCLKIIFGFKLTYDELLEKSGLETLRARRKNLFEKFCIKASNNERFRRKWLPEQNYEDGAPSLRERKKYIEFWARTERLYKSPVYEMRRFLNENERTKK